MRAIFIPLPYLIPPGICLPEPSFTLEETDDQYLQDSKHMTTGTLGRDPGLLQIYIYQEMVKIIPSNSNGKVNLISFLSLV
jgi:hypothetical protein